MGTEIEIGIRGQPAPARIVALPFYKRSTNRPHASNRKERHVPSDYRYTKEHEWIKVEGTSGTIGITDYAQQELGDVVFVELPKVGAKIEGRRVVRHG